MNNQLNEILMAFEPISLPQMETVKLMNRLDRKFWIDEPHLEVVLKELSNHYRILEEDDERSIKYKTTYYDTIDDMLYLHHHNGKIQRYKIRKRKYVKANRNYLEVKFKTEEGRTVKERIFTGDKHHHFTTEEESFIKKMTLHNPSAFLPTLETKFHRITLVNKTINERVTIDIKPEFKTLEGKLKLPNLVIIEVKNEGQNRITPIIQKLEKNGVNKARFSKYCIGRALLDPTLKQNQFKSNISKLVDKIMMEFLPEEHLVLEQA